MTKTFSRDDVGRAFEAVGTRPGELTHLHSQLFSLGRMEGVEAENVPAEIYGAIRDVIGEDGTLTVPAAFEDYARHGEPYDNRRSPVDAAQGILSTHVATLPGAWRSYCPLSGVAGVGPLAEDVCHTLTGSSFGAGSAWDKLYEHNASFTYLGIKPNQALTFVYYVQQRFGVPQLYTKLYTVPVYEDGDPLPLRITSLVRYLNPAFGIGEDTRRFEAVLFEKGLVSEAPVGRGMVYRIESCRRVYDEAIECLKEDLYYFLKAPPTFIDGEIPMDGKTGALVPGVQTHHKRSG